MSIGEKVKTMVQNWLQINPANDRTVVIEEPFTAQGNAVKNMIWYRGDAEELGQLYRQLSGAGDVTETMFWAESPVGERIRKIHTGIPAMMVDTLAYIVKADLGDPDFENDVSAKAKWGEVLKNVDFREAVGQAVAGALAAGDGAFKITVDTEVSTTPLVEFFTGDRVDYVRRSGTIQGVDFYTDYRVGKEKYRLCEQYRKGSVRYVLYQGDKAVPIDRVPELKGLRDVAFAGDYMMAVPFMIYRSSRFPGRGRSIYDNKTGAFDALDEVISQWMDAIRAGRVKKYIPISMLPRDEKTGKPLPVDRFGDTFVQVEQSMGEEGKAAQIQTVQPDIHYDAFLATYSATLDLCLQGILSPASLGIDLGRMSSADAQREKKDITGHTRNAITDALEKTLSNLVNAILKTYDNMRGDAPGEYSPVIAFGEYGAPSFDARVDTVAKAAASGLMSTETQVRELWGSSKDDDWIQQETERIQAEQGAQQEKEPEVGEW